MEAESRLPQRQNWHRLGYLLAFASFLTALAVLFFPWGASAYHLERGGQKLPADKPTNAMPRGQAAERELRKALEWYPENAQAFRLLAQAYQLQGNRQAEVEALARYVNLRPEDPSGYWELAIACERLPVSELAKVADQPCGANEKGREAILPHLWRQAGQSAPEFVRAGDHLRQRREWPEAIAFYQKALLLDPEAGTAWYGLAQVRLAQNEHEEALQAFGRVVDLDSDAELVASAYDQRGQILAEAQRWFEASEELAQAVALAPDHGYYHLRYGWYLYQAGESLQEARAELEIAASLLPTSPWPLLRLADLDFAEKDYAQMLVHAQQAVEVNPELASGWVSQGRALRFLDRLGEAEQVLRHAITLAPNSAAAHAELAQVLKRLDRLDEAIAEFERAVSLAPNNVWYYLGLGSTYQAKGQTTEAVKAYRRVLELNPNNPIASQALEDLEP